MKCYYVLGKTSSASQLMNYVVHISSGTLQNRERLPEHQNAGLFFFGYTRIIKQHFFLTRVQTETNQRMPLTDMALRRTLVEQISKSKQQGRAAGAPLGS